MTRNLKEFVNQTTGARPPKVVSGPTHVAILLGLRNGASMLGEQLGSLAAQTHTDWSLIVSDDGSTDRWSEIVWAFARHARDKRIAVMKGPERGFAQNFLTMLEEIGPTVPYAAFCDQDDVWCPSKLRCALDALADIPAARPALYCGRTILTDQNLTQIGKSPLFQAPPAFQNALVQSIAGGNTMVLNRAAIDLLQDTRRHAQSVVSHDWWAYQLITGAGGRVIYDAEPQVHYRQHGANLIGANTGLPAMAHRIRLLWAGRFRHWNDAQTQALTRAAHWLTPDARQRLDAFKKARTGPLRDRMLALHRSGAMRQTRRGTIALWLAALMRRL